MDTNWNKFLKKEIQKAPSVSLKRIIIKSKKRYKKMKQKTLKVMRRIKKNKKE